MPRSLLTELAHGAAHLILPQLCEGCRAPLLHRQRVLCMACTLELPQTGFHDVADNEAAMRVAGRIPYEHATAFAPFTPDGLLQHLLHRLKYNGRKAIGVFLGQQAGYALKAVPWIKTIDAIIPVPLHPKKEAARGYNQSMLIAQGLGEVLRIPVPARVLIRTRHTESQTKKTREERAANVKDAFIIAPEAAALPAKHVLLVDDVLTTGATLEAAADAVLRMNGMKVSLLTIGMAQS